MYSGREEPLPAPNLNVFTGRSAERREGTGGNAGEQRTCRTPIRESASERLERVIINADIAGFFDAVSHEWLMRFVEHRIGDR